MQTSLYNNDGTLTDQALFLANKKPEHVSQSEFRTQLNDFRSKLNPEELEAFRKLKRRLTQSRWRKEKPEKVKKVNATFYLNNSQKVKDGSAKWRKNNPERTKHTNNIWRKNNPDKTKASRQKSFAKQKTTKYWRNPKEKIRQAVSKAFNRISQKKYANTEAILGCSYEQAVQRIESLFSEGMTRDNYGPKGWHIDHIRPLSSFTAEDLHLANRIENLQPLWAEDNLKKSDSYSF
jgi:hypothetical protein